MAEKNAKEELSWKNEWPWHEGSKEARQGRMTRRDKQNTTTTQCQEILNKKNDRDSLKRRIDKEAW
jgi:hypothetical protein